MSNVIFQPPKGLSWSVKKRPTWSNETQTATSGRQVRAAFFQYPIWEYEMRWEYLKGGEQSSVNTTNDLEALMGFYMARQGSFDSFLYSDPNDNAVIQEVFGTGDGSTTAFQLQRTIGSGVDIVQNLDLRGDIGFALYKYDWQGAKNLLSGSQTMAGSPWVNQNGAVSVTSNAGMAPDGSSTAVLLNYATSDPAQSYHYYGSALNPDGTSYLPEVGVQISTSVYLRADTPQAMIFGDNLGGSLTCSVTTQWQRFTLTSTVNTPGSQAQILFISTPTNISSFRVYAWGPQIEIGGAPTAYQPTGPLLTLGPTLQSQSARANRVRWSNDLSNAVWSATNIAATANAAVAPDGTTTATKLQTTAATGCVFSQTGTGQGITGAMTYSIFVKKGTGATVGNTFDFRNATTGLDLVFFSVNYSTGAITILGGSQTGNAVVTMTRLRNGWWRLTASVTAGISNGDNMQIYVGWIGSTSTIGDNIFAWGAQLEAGTVATSLIPTTTTTVTVTDYSISSTGLITFGSAPLNGASIAWSGAYYYRLHFDDDNLEFDQFMYQLWQLQTVKLQSVIL